MTANEFREKWREQEGPHGRLKWSRVYWQIRAQGVAGSAKDAAASIGVEAGTYRALEREPGSSKSIALGHQDAIRFGRKFGVDWTWLLSGIGTPFDNQLPPAQERVLRAMAETDEDQQNKLADLIESFVRKAG